MYVTKTIENVKDMFKRALIKIWHIIQGNIYNIFNRKKDLYLNRSKICLKCEMKKSFSKIDYCSVCGCPIKTLTRVSSEKCHLKKW